jgi:hypothetical protein
MTPQYIWVNRWEEFQTFQVKKGKPWVPPWIKVYHSLLDEPAYIDLTPETRCLLEGIWKLFARTRGTLRKDTRNLSRQLNQRVTKQQLERLNDAGWLDFCSGTVLEERRNAFWNSSGLDVEVDVEEKRTPTPQPVVPTTPQPDLNGLSLLGDEPARNLAAAARQRALEDEPL